VISKDARRFVFDWTVWNKEISEIVNRLVRALESSKSILARDTGFISPKMVRKLSCCCLVETKSQKKDIKTAKQYWEDYRRRKDD
jgi:inhibitor of KinA sporulation pathway (predicted exonuclease)